MENCLEIRNLKVDYKTLDESRTVLDIKEISVRKGSSYGIVGESGTGKTVLAQMILGLLPTPPGIVQSGEILLEGEDLLQKSKREMQQIRGSRIAMIFQDPLSSLNPVYTVGQQMCSMICEHGKIRRTQAYQIAMDMVKKVKLPDPESTMKKYPHELSGGQRQRIAIARALSVQPKMIILDEPTSAIDVMSQAQILKLLNELKEKMGLAYIIISHDMSVVNYMSDNIMVMYLGKIVEYGNADVVFGTPRHPYTQALFKAIPNVNTNSVEDLAVIRGEVPSAIHPPAGCRFHPRCEYCMDQCRKEEPQPRKVDGRDVSCFLYEN